MNTTLQTTKCCQTDRCPKWGSTTGAALLLIGLLILAGNFIQTNWASLILTPLLGIVFLAWGIYCRRAWLLVPGGILTGIGLGAILLHGPFSQASPTAMGGIFLLCLGAGLALSTALSISVLRCICWWALIPTALLGLAGVNLLMGDQASFSGLHLGQFWPLLLVGVGIYLILRKKHK